MLSAGHKGKDALLALKKDERFQEVRNETVRLVNTVLGTKMVLNEKGGYVNVCKAVMEIEAEVSGLTEEITGLTEEITGLKEENTGLTEEITGLTKENTGLKEQLADRDAQIVALQSQLQAMKRDSGKDT